MLIATQKKLFWFLLLAGAVGCAFFTLAASINGMPRGGEQIPIFIWLALCVAFVVLSVFGLRRCYRLEPERLSGYRHLSIVDFIGAAFFSGFWMAGWQSLSPNTFQPAGAIVSAFFGILFLYALLCAAAKGYSRQRTKFSLAIGIFLFNCGVLELAFLFAIFAMITFVDGPVSAMAEIIRPILGERREPAAFLFMLRFPLVGFLVGWAICNYFARYVKPDCETRLPRAQQQ